MRLVGLMLVLFTAGLIGDGGAWASDRAPVFVVPGRPDVPVIINGRDASYRVVEGDWGLERPGQVEPVIYGPLYVPPSYRPNYYFPHTGRRPAYGRREVIPSAQRVLPPPAETFSRYWGTPPVDPPATIAPPPFYPPPIIHAPRFDGSDNDAVRRRD